VLDAVTRCLLVVVNDDGVGGDRAWLVFFFGPGVHPMEKRSERVLNVTRLLLRLSLRLVTFLV
jgi:hypothetical protein